LRLSTRNKVYDDDDDDDDEISPQFSTPVTLELPSFQNGAK